MADEESVLHQALVRRIADLEAQVTKLKAAKLRSPRTAYRISPDDEAKAVLAAMLFATGGRHVMRADVDRMLHDARQIEVKISNRDQYKFWVSLVPEESSDAD